MDNGSSNGRSIDTGTVGGCAFSDDWNTEESTISDEVARMTVAEFERYLDSSEEE